jgi:hypothetical protein
LFILNISMLEITPIFYTHKSRYIWLCALPDYVFKKTNSVAWVRERTIQTERPLLVREVIANFSG